jgi:hypothetical protein
MNSLPNVWTQSPNLTLKGPVLRSFRYNARMQTFMDYFECAVANKSQLPETRFGAFAEIRNRGNANIAYLEVWTAPGFFDEPSVPVFTEQTRDVFNLTEFIQEAKEIKKVVQIGTQIIPTIDTWEAVIEPLEGVHGMLTMVEVVTLNDIKSGVRDVQLEANHKVNRSLVRAGTAEAAADYPVELIAGTADGGTHSWVEYTELRYGWYERRSEGMSTDDTYGYGTTRSYFWPPVMTFFEVADLEGEQENGEKYIASILMDVRYDESYNGPCKATIVRGWVPNNAAVPSIAPTQMITDSFDYQGIFFNFTSRDCLHPSMQIYESVQDHPVLAGNQYRVKNFPASVPEVWPAQVTFYEDPAPYKGGFIRELVTIYKPGTA